MIMLATKYNFRVGKGNMVSYAVVGKKGLLVNNRLDAYIHYSI